MRGVLGSGALGIHPLGLFAGDTQGALACFACGSKSPCGGVVGSSNEIFQASLDLEQLTQPLIDLVGFLDRKLRHARYLGYLEYRGGRINLAFTQPSIKMNVLTHSTPYGWTSAGFPAGLGGT